MVFIDCPLNYALQLEQLLLNNDFNLRELLSNVILSLFSLRGIRYIPGIIVHISRVYTSFYFKERTGQETMSVSEYGYILNETEVSA